MQALQILIDGFAISSLYGLGAIGFTLMFGVCGVLNLAHGGIMLIAALIGWGAAADYGAGPFGGAAIGIIAGLAASYLTYFIVVRPLQTSRAIPKEEEEIFILVGTLLWGIMIQVGMDYIFTDNPVTLVPMARGVVNILGVRTPRNEVLIAVVCWLAIIALHLLVNHTRIGKQLLAASINPRGLTLLGFELSR
ncbi:MAG: branched-chain amino acid ABC transporter permease, partial [Acetobacteraceae bacterium]